MVTITDDDDPAVTVSFEQAAYSVTEGTSVAVTVTLSAAPERLVVVPITATETGADNTDYSGVPATVSFAADETSQTITFAATQDMVDDDNESVQLTFGSLPTGTAVGSTAAAVVTITDDDDRRQGDPGDGIVVTIVKVPNGTVMSRRSTSTSLGGGETVEDGSTAVEGTWAPFRLEFTTVGRGLPSNNGVMVEVRFFWQNDSPLVSHRGELTLAGYWVPLVDVWDTSAQIFDNDVGNPDSTVTIRITDCKTAGCTIGTPSEITLTIVDDDGGPDAAVPGPPGTPRLVCASSGGGYDDTGIAARWDAPNFVGGAPVESYRLRYRQSSQFVQGKLILHPWEYLPGSVAATSATTSATITGLMTRVDYTVQVQAVNGNGPGLWSSMWYFTVGPSDEICDIIDQLTP